MRVSLQPNLARTACSFPPSFRQAYKYIPYGRVGETIPYLLRRAQENSGMLSGATHERGLLVKEIRRRVFGLE